MKKTLFFTAVAMLCASQAMAAASVEINTAQRTIYVNGDTITSVHYIPRSKQLSVKTVSSTYNFVNVPEAEGKKLAKQIVTGKSGLVDLSQYPYR